MKKPVLVLLLAVSVVFLVSGVSLAQEGSVELKYGTFNPTGDLDDDEWDQGTSAELAGTYRENSMAVQGAVGVYTTDFNESYTGLFGRVKEEDTLTVIPVSVSLLGFFDSEPLHIYGGGGIGYYFAEFEGKLNFKDAGFKWKDSDKDSVFGYHVMAGLNYNVTEHFLIGVEGKMLWTNGAEFKMKDKGLKATYEAELNGYVLAAKIGVSF